MFPVGKSGTFWISLGGISSRPSTVGLLGGSCDCDQPMIGPVYVGGGKKPDAGKTGPKRAFSLGKHAYLDSLGLIDPKVRNGPPPSNFRHVFSPFLFRVHEEAVEASEDGGACHRPNDHLNGERHDGRDFI